jgi:hypothetical protein
MPPDSPAHNRIARFFDEIDLPYDSNDDGSVLTLTFADGDTDLSWNSVAYDLDDGELFVFFSVAPDDVPAPQRLTVSEYLTRANFGLPIGSFEMDWDDGEVRCRTSIHVGSAPVSSDMIRTIVQTNIGLAMRYFPELAEVVSGRMSPSDAVASAESRSVEPPAF